MDTLAEGRAYERILLPAPASVGLARDIVDGRLRAWGLTSRYDDIRNDVRSIVSELTQNALKVTKPGGIIKLKVALRGDEVRVSVWDASHDAPVSADPQLTLEVIDALPKDHEFGGYGLPLVERLSVESGFDLVWPTGKWVWACLKVTV